MIHTVKSRALINEPSMTELIYLWNSRTCVEKERKNRQKYREGQREKQRQRERERKREKEREKEGDRREGVRDRAENNTGIE